MKLNATSTVIWAAGIEDRPSALAEKLQPLAQAGANLAFVLARRAPDKPGKGVVFVAPLEGVKQCRAAVNSGFIRTNSLHALRVEGTDKPGVALKLTRTIGAAGINLRGFTANVVGSKFVAYLAFDDEDDVKSARQALAKLK
jgi:hypothetical protein